MRRLNYLLTCTVIVGLFSIETAQAQKLACPGATGCPVPGMPFGQQCTIDSFPDTKGGIWKESCTNVAGGDFVWTYDEAGGKVVKEIGRCVYPAGQNSNWYIRDPLNPKQVLKYLHVVINGLNKNEATIHLFDKVTNTGIEIEIVHNKTENRWEEVERAGYTSLDIPGGGTIPRAYQPAAYATDLHLVAASVQANQQQRQVQWQVFPADKSGPQSASLTTADSVYIDGLSPGAVVSSPGFSVTSTPPGITLTPTAPLSVNTGDSLATVLPPDQTTPLYYSLHVNGADAFYQSILGGTLIGASWATQKDLSDMVGYAATAGMLDIELGCCLTSKGTRVTDVSASYCGSIGGTWTLGDNCIPTLSEWGVTVMVILVLTAGTVVVMRRRAAVA